MDKNQSDQKPISNSFSKFLSEFRKGESLNDLSEALQKVVLAVKETGRSASLSYTVKVTPVNKGAGIAVGVIDKITTKLPEAERSTGIFFATENGGLCRDNPDQAELNLKTVPSLVAATESAPLREVVGQ